jgi:endonuclease-8
VAGIGNFWKAELCFAAALDPWRPLAEVVDEEATTLVSVARELMRESARTGFSARPRALWRRAGRPCPRCGAIVRARGQGENNRITFWCPSCQR